MYNCAAMNVETLTAVTIYSRYGARGSDFLIPSSVLQVETKTQLYLFQSKR
jgi:hypothetical protein